MAQSETDIKEWLAAREARLKWLEENMADVDKVYSPANPMAVLLRGDYDAYYKEHTRLLAEIEKFKDDKFPVRKLLNCSEQADPSNLTREIFIAKGSDWTSRPAFEVDINNKVRHIRSVNWHNDHGWFALTTDPVKYIYDGNHLLAIITINVIDKTPDE